MPARLLKSVLVVLVVLYGAFLRFDALTLTYGPVEYPAWLRSIQQSRGSESHLRPDSITWNRVEGRYISDPFTYLQYARAMQNFYAAHRREPVFPLATKISLALLNDQDVAVSFASATFSVLTVVATFLLGFVAFNYWVGLAAAAGMALEYDVITSGIGGWRDDAFSFAVVLCAYWIVRFARTAARRDAVLLGVLAAFAALIRITSLLFLVPAFAALLLVRKPLRREHAQDVGLAVAIMIALIAPYLFNCWRALGDPFYAVNAHVATYRETGESGAETLSAADYLTWKARQRPIETLDTAILGLTWYPFANKWYGFDRWMPSLGKWLSWCALSGLLLLPASTAGRLVLLVLAASLVPYALTWKLIFDWRFTAHAYPFFLIAACLAISQLIEWSKPSVIRATLARRSQLAKTLFIWSAALFVVLLVAYIVTRTLPVLVAREALANGEAITIMAGGRDRGFFADGWGPAITEGNVTARMSQGDTAVVWLPLVPFHDGHMTVRLDPSPRPVEQKPANLPDVQLFLNGEFFSTLKLSWNPQRVGGYDLHIPRRLMKDGRNQLTFKPQPKSDGAHAIRLWYVRVRPASKETTKRAS